MQRASHRPEARRAILEIVENPLRDGTPPEIRATPDRLVKSGTSRSDAVDQIACVLVCELDDMLRANEFFDEARCTAALRALPRLPWDEVSSKSD